MRKLLILLLGIAIGILLSVGGVYLVGPRGSETKMDLYTGQTWSYRSLLWHRWIEYEPDADHTIWAKKHKRSDRAYYPVSVCSTQRDWFGSTVHGDGFVRDTVRQIYELSIPEEDKIGLLLHYHRDVDEVIGSRREDGFRDLCDAWGKRLDEKP